MKTDNNISDYTQIINSINSLAVNKLLKLILSRKDIGIEPYRYEYTLFFKTINSLDTANLLTMSLLKKPTVSDSIFLIHRTTISDLIIFYYLVTISKFDEDSIEEWDKKYVKNIYRMYFDHLDRTVKDINGFYKSANKASDNEVSKIINDLKQIKPEFYNSDGSAKYEPLRLQVSTMCNQILSKKKKGDNVDLIVIGRNLYDKFSKYEHFGDLTYDLTHRQFDDNRINELFEDIWFANKFVLQHLDRMIKCWVEASSYEYKEFVRLRTLAINTKPKILFTEQA